jgi:hypothetical protein
MKFDDTVGSILNEAFNKSLPYKFNGKSGKTTFESNGETYTVIWEFKPEYDLESGDTADIYEIWFVDSEGSVEVTGAGNAMQVFATVISVIKDVLDWIDKNEPDINNVMYRSDVAQKSRVSLYKILTRKLGSYKGWEYDEENSDPNYGEYMISKDLK